MTKTSLLRCRGLTVSDLDLRPRNRLFNKTHKLQTVTHNTHLVDILRWDLYYKDETEFNLSVLLDKLNKRNHKFGSGLYLYVYKSMKFSNPDPARFAAKHFFPRRWPNLIPITKKLGLTKQISCYPKEMVH